MDRIPKKPQIADNILDNARRMRSEPTDVERKLWGVLRGRRLGGFKFRRQHPVGPYIIDFYCDEAKLAVELDGGQHSEPELSRRDEKRTAYLAGSGIRNLRFWDHDALRDTDAVAETIYQKLTDAT